MSEDMQILIFWLIGWVIVWFGYYVDKAYVDVRYKQKFRKRYYVWKGFVFGATSWLTILIVIVMMGVCGIFYLEEYIENKLK